MWLWDRIEPGPVPFTRAEKRAIADAKKYFGDKP
jgi:hypothetical protein